MCKSVYGQRFLEELGKLMLQILYWNFPNRYFSLRDQVPKTPS